MNSITRYTVAGALAVVTTVGIGALSQVPYRHEAADHAVLRLAWRARGIRVENCRTLSAEELARIPKHMRRTQECEGAILPYRLRVLLDGEPVADQVIRPAGIRADRPLFVFQETTVSPGTHDLKVTFALVGEVPADALQDEATPVSLEFESVITLDTGEVALVTYDAESGRLVLKGYGKSE
jgi:hypothetical protein